MKICCPHCSEPFDSDPIVEHKGVRINTLEKTAEGNGQKIVLTDILLRVFTTLLMRSPRAVTAESLFEAMYWDRGGNTDMHHANVKMNIYRLRPMALSIGCDIATINGVGYRMLVKSAESVSHAANV